MTSRWIAFVTVLTTCQAPTAPDPGWPATSAEQVGLAPLPAPLGAEPLLPIDPVDPVDPPVPGEFRCGPLTRIVPDDLAPGDGFGVSVAMSGDTILVGAPTQNALGDHSGAAYVFVRTPSGWEQQAKVLAPVVPGASTEMQFGSSVALDGDTAIIGAPSGVFAPAAAYVFVRTGGIWSLQAEMVGTEDGDDFAYGVGIDGDSAIVSAYFSRLGPGLRVFVRTADVWTQETEVWDPARLGFRGLAGGPAAIRGEAILGEQYNGDIVGRASVFSRSSGGWEVAASFVPADTHESGDTGFYGHSVDIDQDVAIVGAPGYNEEGVVDAGAAYVYHRDVAGGWTLGGKVVALDANHLGSSVGVRGDLAMVGAKRTDGSAVVSGAMYAFVRTGGTWTQAVRIFPVDATEKEFFGSSLGMSEGRVAIGAPGREEFSGAAYVVACANAAALELVCPEALTIECDAAGGVLSGSAAVVAWRAEAAVSGGCPDVVLTDDAPDVVPPSCETEPQPVTVTFSATDACDQTATCTSTVTVLDRTPPTVNASLTQACLWSPNHEFADIGSYAVTDACDAAPPVSLAACSDEAPASEPGAGGPEHCPDAWLSEGSIQLRAERAGPSGADNGRVYTRVAVTARDACGNEATTELPRGTIPDCPGVACVVHDQSEGACAAVEDVASWDATSCGPDSACP